jgi:hydroxymethylbilane synthase
VNGSGEKEQNMKTLRAATRGSKLALAQTNLAADALRKLHPGLDIQIHIVRTEGDQQADLPLWKLEGSGFFTARLEQALLTGQADLAVHSYKDLPTEETSGLHIAAVLERLFPEDVMVCRRPAEGLNEIPQGARLGTSSVRRSAQLLARRPDLDIRPIRGNVETRLRKLRAGEFDAIVLARAGLERLGITDWTGFCFDPADFLPAPAQGAIAVQCRIEDQQVSELIRRVHHKATGLVTSAERRVLARLHPGCHAPVGAYARLDGSRMTLAAFAADPSGKPFLKEEICGPADRAIEYADQLAQRLLSKGAGDILKPDE